jgi:hypothetical protein
MDCFVVSPRNDGLTFDQAGELAGRAGQLSRLLSTKPRHCERSEAIGV